MRDRLRFEIAQRIAAQRPARNDGTSAWWPLARPAWTAEECVAALTPWIEARTTMWNRTAALEVAFAKAFQHEAATCCSSGSAADLLAARALVSHGILAPGDTVLVPAVTWPTQVTACLWAGLRVHLLDVDPDTLTVAPETIAKAWDETGAKAVFATHILGLPWNMDAVTTLCEDIGMVLLEDCCEALGSTWDRQPVGTFGLLATYSFFVAHHLACGEGGMVGINDAALLPRLQTLRAHGWTRNVGDTSAWAEALADFDGDPRYAFVEWGTNLRPTETAASVLMCQLVRWPEIQAARERVAARLLAAVEDAPGCRTPRPLPRATPCWFGIPILCDSQADRDRLVDRLEAEGIETRGIIAGNLARQPVCQMGADDRVTWGALPGADRISACGLYIGIIPDASEAEVARACEVVGAGIR